MLFGTETAELEVLNFIQDVLGCGFMDFAMTRITALGNAGLIWILAGVGLMCTKKYRRGGVFLLVGLLLGLIFGNVILKNLIARPRPCWLVDVPLLIPNPTDFSFPSGHTLSSFISVFVLFRLDRRLGVLALVLAIIMAFSRLYLYVHFPTDILGGLALAYLIYFIVKRYIKKGCRCELQPLIFNSEFRSHRPRQSAFEPFHEEVCFPVFSAEDRLQGAFELRPWHG